LKFHSNLSLCSIVIEPYNCVLSAHQLLENSHEIFCIDNTGLRYPSLTEKETLPFDYQRTVISDQLNADLRKLATNMVPFL
jgi:tubulin beta